MCHKVLCTKMKGKTKEIRQSFYREKIACERTQLKVSVVLPDWM